MHRLAFELRIGEVGGGEPCASRGGVLGGLIQAHHPLLALPVLPAAHTVEGGSILTHRHPEHIAIRQGEHESADDIIGDGRVGIHGLWIFKLAGLAGNRTLLTPPSIHASGQAILGAAIEERTGIEPIGRPD